MNDSLRACIAYIVGHSANSNSRSSVYDYGRSTHVSISGTIEGKNVNIFDHSRSCHVGGTLPSPFDYGQSSHISLEIKDKSFNGFDHATSKHYSGTFNENSISIYDYENSKHHSYSV